MDAKKQQKVAARQVFEEQVMQPDDDCAEAEVANLYQNDMPAQQMQQAQYAAPNAPYMQQQMALNNNISPANMFKKPKKPTAQPLSGQKTSEELQMEKGELQVKERGCWFWRTVVVPPNAYVVQTRRGAKEPVTMGLGISFRYRPRTDSYFVVPAALQTIGIIARGISREKQGINILAYVQWLVSDFSIAYRHLDFSDPKDPMAIVNAQLREQAEAAIKDKIATMTVEEILTDKAPVIQELTERMKVVAEGKNQGDSLSRGLGLQIVTVQIKEAYVSSTMLWEFLQAPFRNEREREARLSRLKIEEEIREQELNNKKLVATSEAQTRADIEKFKAEKESESFEVVTREQQRRQKLEIEGQQHNIALEEETELIRRLSAKKLQENQAATEQEIALITFKHEQEKQAAKARSNAEQTMLAQDIAAQSRMKALELAETLGEAELRQKVHDLEIRRKLAEAEYGVKRQELEFKLTLQDLEEDQRVKQEERKFQIALAQEQEKHRVLNAQKQQELLQERTRQETLNLVSSSDLSRRLIERLPELVKAMPQIKELKTIQISSNGQDDATSSLTAYLAKLLSVAQLLGFKLPEHLTAAAAGKLDQRAVSQTAVTPEATKDKA